MVIINDYYRISSEEVVEKFNSSMEKGLTIEETNKRQNKYGKNKLPEPEKKNPILVFLSNFNNVLIYLLMAAAVITGFLDHLIDAAVIFAVVIINAVIGFIQEGKAEKAIDGIRKMLSLEANVIRDGSLSKINSENLVPGDIVEVKAGDKVPADMRILKSNNLRAEESALTGESIDSEKNSDLIESEAVIGDRSNMLFSGTLITSGKGLGIVTATGEETEIGKISEMITGVEKITTPLIEKINGFGKSLSIITVILAATFFAFGFFVRDYELVDMFLATVSLVVAAIPEGLPVIMTITLAVGVQKMVKRNAIIRRLPSVETLGSINVICSDKTGTLTKNEMTVRSVITFDKSYCVTGEGYEPEGSIIYNDEEAEAAKDEVLSLLIKTGRLCNDSDIEKKDDGHWGVVGTPTEGALISLAYKSNLYNISEKRISSLPFNSANKYMVTLNEVDDKKYLLLKGAPERVLKFAKFQLAEKGKTALSKDYWLSRIEELAEKGERVIAFAYKEWADGEKLDPEDGNKEYVFLGITGIIDPPREEAMEAIKECKEAGINVKMITGDHSVTARVIAEKLGIGNGNGVLTGSEIEKMSSEELKEKVLKYDIFARTEPEHKLRLVEAIQQNDLLCAMTGDGVNDAPALKKANIGIAMGIKGTEVSKEAAEMVLADDNFASIVNAVEEGRTVYDNIKKNMIFMLPTNGAEMIVLMAAVLIGLTMPITPVQILWVNMVTTITLEFALIFEPMEKKVMTRPPRPKNEPILNSYLVFRTAYVALVTGLLTFGLYNLFHNNGESIAYSRTVALNMLVLAQAFYLVNCRKIHDTTIGEGFFENKKVFYVIGLLVILQLFITYVPFLNTFFGTVPIRSLSWIYPVAGGLFIFFFVELEKIITGKFSKM
jgi:magnesium-transporting ATPase (P-type)